MDESRAVVEVNRRGSGDDGFGSGAGGCRHPGGRRRLWPQSYVEQYQANVESGGPSTQKVQLPFVQFMIDRAVRHINKDVREAIFPVGGRAGERALGRRVGIPICLRSWA